MTGKANALPVIGKHLDTLRSPESGGFSKRDLATHYLLPVLIGVGAAGLGLRLKDAGQVIAGVSILAGLSFALAVFVFQLRLEAGRDPRVGKGDLLLELLEQLFANVLYSIVVGLSLVVVLVTATSVGRPSGPPPETTVEALAQAAAADYLNGVWTALVVALSLHFIVTLLMCIKRLRAAHRELTI